MHALCGMEVMGGRRPALAVAIVIAVLSSGGFDPRCEATAECGAPGCIGAGSQGEVEDTVTVPDDIEDHALECMVMATPGEDAEGRHPVWWLDGGVPGHWSSGSSVAVFEGDAVNIVIMASNCQSAILRLGCRAHFDLGDRVTFALDLPWLSPGETLDVYAAVVPCLVCPSRACCFSCSRHGSDQLARRHRLSPG